MTMPVEVELTPAQHKLWDDTRAALVWHCPAFTHIFYSMMSNKNGKNLAYFTPDVPIAATDGRHVMLNPEKFFEHNLQERIFVVAHEISHGIFGHCEKMERLRIEGKVRYPDGKELSYDQEDMNKAMDYMINDMLIESKIGQYNTNWLHDTVKGKHTDDVLVIYRRIHEDKKNGGQGGKPGQSFDQHLQPGTSTGQDAASATAQRSDVAWSTAVAGAIASARAQGKLPAALDRMLSEVLEPTIDWTDKVIGFFNRKPGGGTYDWRKPDRRLVTRNIIAPGRSGFGCGLIVIAGDTSGSITPKILDVFFGNMYGILDDVRPQKILVVWCDAKVHRVDEIEDVSDLMDVRYKGAPGGGGTSFVPVFDYIAENGLEPDALIYLTDGDGTFPDTAPDYDVLWGDISCMPTKYPFGEQIDLPIS